jgi:glycosyltransferase 2 family protein
LSLVKRWRIGLLGAVCSVLAIYFIVSQVNLTQLGIALQTARYVYLIPCVALLLAGLVTRAIRWRVLLSDGLPIGRTFSIMNVAYLVNGVLPLRIGEVARTYLATRADPPVPVFKTVSTIIVERLLDLLAVLVMLAFAISRGPLPDEIRVAALVSGPISIIGFIVLVVMAGRRAFVERLMKSVTSRVPALQRWNLMGWLNHFLDGLQPLSQPSALVKALWWTVASWGLSICAGYVLMFAFYDHADWAVTCLYISAAALAIAVPAVPGNVGTYEVSILLALQALGYGQSASTAGAFAVVVHGINLAVHAVTGLIGILQEGVSLEQLSQGVQRMQNAS